MDSTYKEFIVPGGITYVGKPNAPVAHSGHKRVKISWLRGADPNVDHARIFWNNYADSAEVSIPAAADTISYTINDLPEKTYSFTIKTYDTEGNSSVPVEVFGASYGEIYQAGLLSRPIDRGSLYPDSISIKWGGADISNGTYATEVKYINTTGDEQIKRVPASQEISGITDLKAGTTFFYRTIYLPDSSSIDTFYTDFVELKTFFLSQENWSIIGFSSQHPGDENVVTHVIDGNPTTRWHALVSSSYPHFFIVDMNILRTITSFSLYRNTGDDRGCNTFQLLVSTDNISWTDLGTFNFIRTLDGAQSYNIPSHPKARYFKFIGLTGPQPYIVLGDISAYGL